MAAVLVLVLILVMVPIMYGELPAWKLTREAREKKERIAKEKKSSTTNFTRPFCSVLRVQGGCCRLEPKILNFEPTAHCGFKAF